MIVNQRYDPHRQAVDAANNLSCFVQSKKSDLHCALTQHLQHLREKLIHSVAPYARYIYTHVFLWMALTCTAIPATFHGFLTHDARKDVFDSRGDFSWMKASQAARPLLMHILATSWRIVCVARVLDEPHTPENGCHRERQRHGRRVLIPVVLSDSWKRRVTSGQQASRKEFTGRRMDLKGGRVLARGPKVES